MSVMMKYQEQYKYLIIGFVQRVLTIDLGVLRSPNKSRNSSTPRPKVPRALDPDTPDTTNGPRPYNGIIT